ncbi:MAG: hypothetical protein ACKVOK_12225 [Flavobacteriales bacterium]
MSQRLMAELLGISKFDLGMHERNMRLLPSEADLKMTEFQLRMMDFDPQAAIQQSPDLVRMQIQALEKQANSLYREVGTLYKKLTSLEKELEARTVRFTWAEGFLRTMQYMMDQGYTDYYQSVLIQMEFHMAMKWYAENSPALLDCLQTEIDAVRMRYEGRKKVWEEMVVRIEELSRYRP